MSKKPLNLLIEADLVEKARQTGIVISRFLENKLQEHFQFMNAIGSGKRKEISPYGDGNNPFLINREPSSIQGKSNNLMPDNQNSSRACGVAWYPCGFGSHRLAFKSQQAHDSLSEKIQATDSDGDEVYYFIEWGDETNSSWIGPYPSGDLIPESHTWSKKGTYTIRAKAKDIYGNESGWGQLSVTMPCSYNIPFVQFWIKLFERFPHAFPIIRQLMGY